MEINGIITGLRLIILGFLQGDSHTTINYCFLTIGYN